MTAHKTNSGISRRAALKAGLAAATAPLLQLAGGSAWAQAAAPARKATKALDFMTGADVAKAEQEGEVVFYTHDSEPAGAAIIEAFTKDFPKIKGSYVRAQTGALYSKVIAERSAGRYTVDVIQFSDTATGLDFQKKGGYMRYVSPQVDAYAPEHLSNPVGDYFWIGLTIVGISYNTDKVKADEAPKNWKDLLNPRWKGVMSVKQSTSGTQFAQWYELRRMYGEGFWKEFAKQRPRGFDSRAQIFDRLAKGDDKVCAMAEYAGYLLQKEKGSPLVFVSPPDGLVGAALVNGVADKAPHPEAAKLFVDWLMSPRGQGLYQNNKFLYYASVRKDAPPMPGGVKLHDFKLLIPADMAAFTAAQPAFLKEWNAMLGL
jgi:iron(III) transport system substrate-binding protein